MMDWLQTQLDAIDVVVLTAVFLTMVYFLWKNHLEKSANSKYTTALLPACDSSTKSTPERHSSFIERMKSEARKVLILFGSQTGTAEELAGRLAKDVQNYGQKALLLDPEEMDVEEFDRIKEIPDALVILCMATYGEGDPTDNAQEFYLHISQNEIDLTGINFAVFGLGNKTYEHFNKTGKYFDRRMEELGAKRIYDLGLGDDDGNLEEDFLSSNTSPQEELGGTLPKHFGMFKNVNKGVSWASGNTLITPFGPLKWRENFWPVVTNIYGWEITETSSVRQYRYEIINDPSTKLFTGEYGRLGSFEKQRPPFDQKNPFVATVRINRELHSVKSERSCRHIEFIINGSRIRYEAGDHLGVFPTNDAVLVEELGRLIDVDMDQCFSLINLDEESLKKNPFPCPCTVRTAFTHYVDICAPVKSHVLKALAAFTTAESEKERLLFLSTANEEGLKEYSSYIQKERRSIIDILRAFSTCRPPVDCLLELLPRLQARYYSISSSPKYNNDAIAITVIVTKYMIGDRVINGVCTNFLLRKDEGSKVPIFVRRSTMRLPHRLMTPVIMIGPGTGFAPFRSFLQERAWQKEQGKETGQMSLYYGCRHPEHDYIYEEELTKFLQDGVLTELHIAFSRITTTKVYVQDKIWANREAVWKAIENGAHIYVCGDARSMARDVQNTFIRIFVEVGRKSESEAQEFQKNLEKKRRYQADVWS